MKKKLCIYYQAHIRRSQYWRVSFMLRGTEHVVFDRALKKESDRFEFFVPVDTEIIFLEIMRYAYKNDLVISYEKKENRLFGGSSVV